MEWERDGMIGKEKDGWSFILLGLVKRERERERERELVLTVVK